MSVANGEGAAYDATAEVTESDDLRRKLAAIESKMSPEERTRLAERDDLLRALHEQERLTEGSPAHAAHVAQLQRLWRDAHHAVHAAVAAHRRAQETEDGALTAHRLATEQLRVITAELEAAGVSTDGLE